MLVQNPNWVTGHRVLQTLAVVGAGLLAYQGTSFLVGSEGLRCEDFPNPGWTDAPLVRRVQRDLTTPLLGNVLAATHEQFSTVCEGWLFVSAPGQVTFLLNSDDGSDLFIDNVRLIDNSGRHGTVAKLGTLVLMPGAHPLRIRYSQEAGDYSFSLLVAFKGETLHPVTPWDLSRRPLSRVEHQLRPWARPARMMLLLVATLLIGRLWRRELHRGARAALAAGALAHDMVVSDRRRAVLALLAIAIGTRALLTVTTHPILWPDSHSYYLTARDFLAGHWTSHEIFRTPGFSAFMALFLREGETPAAGLALIAAQRSLGVVATLLVYAIGRHAFSPAIAFYAAAVWTLGPLQLFYETSVASEALFVFTLVLTVWSAIRLLEAPRLGAFATTGLLCGVAVLTRPVGKGLVLLIALAGWSSHRPLRLAGTVVALTAYLLCTVPWMYVNSQTYGFFGISRGEGLGLFMRAFDIERFPPSDSTKFTAVDTAFRHLSSSEPYVHYRVRDELNFQRGYSAARTDAMMAGFAREAIERHPVSFATGVFMDWIGLFMAPHRSVGICVNATGPQLCAERNRGDSLPAFPAAPAAGGGRLQMLVVTYFDKAYWIVPLLTPLALVGAFLTMKRAWRGEAMGMRLLLLAVIAYFSLVSVTFNTTEDRYRLPVDAFIVLFALEGLASGSARLTARIASELEPVAHPQSKSPHAIAS